MKKFKQITIFIILISGIIFFSAQFALAVTKTIGQSATITATCSDPEGNLSQCKVTSPCSATCSSSPCSCSYTCSTVGTYNACGEAVDTHGLTDSACFDTVQCNPACKSDGTYCTADSECCNNSCLDNYCRKCYYSDLDGQGYSETCKNQSGTYTDYCGSNAKKTYWCTASEFCGVHSEDCPANYTCKVQGNGRPDCLKNNGQTCSVDSECYYGYCRDGYCCNWACDGTCMQCNLSGYQGTCMYSSSGSDPASECSTGTCRTGNCDGGGNCGWPADDSGCGTIDCDGLDNYYQSGIESATDTEYCYKKDYSDITSGRCEGLGDCKDANTAADCTSSSDSFQYSCGTCKYISASNCTGGTLGSCSNYAAGTSCGTNLECDSSGNCVASCDSTNYTSCAVAKDFGTSGGTQSGMCGASQYYRVTVPAGQTCDVTWTLSPSAGDYDLYTSWSNGSCPSTSSYSCKSTYSGTTADSCSTTGLASGTYYALSNQYSAGKYSISASLTNCQSACSALSYPTGTWQRVWYDFSNNCLGNGPDQSIEKFDDNWGTNAPNPNFPTFVNQIQFTSSRKIYFSTDGLYRIHLQSDDGSRLYINDVLYTNDAKWGNHGWSDDPQKYIDITFVGTGSYDFRIDYYENTGDARITFGYEKVCEGNIALDVVPSATQSGNTVNLNVSGLSYCDGKQVRIRENPCDAPGEILVGTCNVSGSGCTKTVNPTCSYGPPCQKNYWACIDKNSDGDMADTGESSGQKTLQIIETAIGCVVDGTCGYYHASGILDTSHWLGATGSVNKQGGSVVNECDKGGVKCKTDASPTTSNGSSCSLVDSCAWGGSSWSGAMTGKWDASKNQCIYCEGQKQSKRIMTTSQRCWDVENNSSKCCYSVDCPLGGSWWIIKWGECCHNWTELSCASAESPDKNDTCESACDASVAPECDDKQVDDDCGPGKKCGDDCQCGTYDTAPPTAEITSPVDQSGCTGSGCWFNSNFPASFEFSD